MYILEVLRGVLYPEAHKNGFKKKKKKNELLDLHLGRICFYYTALIVASIFAMGRLSSGPYAPI